jgi:hypothetical protein
MLEPDTAESQTFAVQYPGSLLALSEGLAEVTGLDMETLRATPWVELVHPEDVSLIRRWSEQLHLGRQVTPARARFRMGDGSYRVFELAATADPEGELLVGTARALDETEPRPLHGKLRAGEIELDERARAVTAAGRRLTLTVTEFELLGLLLRRRGAVVRDGDIAREVWGYQAADSTDFLPRVVSSLRLKFLDAGVEDPIRAVRGAGYVVR